MTRNPLCAWRPQSQSHLHGYLSAAAARKSISRILGMCDAPYAAHAGPAPYSARPSGGGGPTILRPGELLFLASSACAAATAGLPFRADGRRGGGWCVARRGNGRQVSVVGSELVEGIGPSATTRGTCGSFLPSLYTLCTGSGRAARRRALSMVCRKCRFRPPPPGSLPACFDTAWRRKYIPWSLTKFESRTQLESRAAAADLDPLAGPL